MRFFLSIVAAFLGTIAAAIVLVLILVGILASQDSTPTVASNSVLVLDLDRPLPETQPQDPFAEMFGGKTVTLHQVTGALEKAAADDRIVGVWVRSSGVPASWATMAELREALETYRQSGKPLVASSGTNGFSQSGYYLASAADSVFTPPDAMFLMNGLHISMPFFGGMFDRLGIDPIVFRAGDYKSAAENITERGFSPENREQYSELLHFFDDRFRSSIAGSRNLDRAAIDQVIAEGGLHAAEQAHALGLVDRLLYEHDVRQLWRAHTDQSEDETLRTVSLSDYAQIAPSAAGVEMGNRNNRVAVVHATGTIMPGSGGGDALMSDDFIKTLDEARYDDRVRAIVVRIDSPGGSATASDVMWDAIRDAATEKPVIASMGTVAASGGYYIAAPADVIVAEPATITGSIGVISILFDAEDFLQDRLGVSIDTIQTGPAAGLGALGESINEYEARVMQQLTDRVYSSFVDRVATGRNLSPDSVRALGGGRIYTGERALQIGLVDELGTLEDAVAIAAQRAELEEGDYRILVLPRQRPLFERLTEAFSTQALMNAWMQRTMTPEERLLRSEAEQLREAVRVNATPQMRMWGIPEIR